MTTVSLYPAPQFVQVLSQAGAVTAGSMTLSDALYPLTTAFLLGTGAKNVLLYWQATSETVGDFLDLQLLIRDSKATVPLWVEGPEQFGVTSKRVVRFPVSGMVGHLHVRVLGATTAIPATALIVRAAVDQEG
uniref:Uncharacterized protein n=1 Tax=viral metagenome TaxID=1070528 RepID=A0A6M3XV60_9ZZZZ